MKVVSILLMLFGLALIVLCGMLWFFGFVMSFDAPGSASDPQAWAFRGMMFLPIIVLGTILIFAFVAFSRKKYARSAAIGSVFVILMLLGVGALLISSQRAMHAFKQEEEIRAKEAELYPTQYYLRQGSDATDSIIVFPSRIVSYRLHAGRTFPWRGPLGDLNTQRDLLVYNRSTDTQLTIEELTDFKDASGRSFTEVYRVQ